MPWPSTPRPRSSSTRATGAVSSRAPMVAAPGGRPSQHRHRSAGTTCPSNLYAIAVAIDHPMPTTLYVATKGGGVFKSIDGGNSWSALNTGLFDLQVEALVVDPQTPTTLYAGTRAGVFSIQQRDTTPPTVALMSPSDGDTVSGTITVKASAADAVGVAAVQFLVDGVVIGDDMATPYEATWDTRTVPDGTHTLTARARDEAGNSAISAPVRVTVANGPLPTLTLARSEETSATLAGGWFEITSAGVGVTLSGGRAVAAAAAATASFTFTGTGVRWVGVPCEICGIANVLIDGTRVATVDTFAATRP